jgi:hypothetical protein
MISASTPRRPLAILLATLTATALMAAVGCDRGAAPQAATVPVAPSESTQAAASSAAASSAAAPSTAATQPAPASTPTPAATPAPQPPVAQAADLATQAAQTAAPASSDEPVDAQPPVRLDPPVMDFGIIPPSVEREGVVKLINTGSRELEILTVQPSCKCTTLGDDLSGKKIPPGGFVELKAAMKAQSAPGTKRAEIKVLIDGYTQVLNVQLRNEVSLPVRVSPAYLNVVKGQPLTGRTVIESIDKQPFKVCAVGGKRPNLVGFNPDTDAPRNQYLLEWNFERDFEPGKAPRYWIIETDRADCPLVDLFVRHESTMPLPKLKLTDYRHTFGRIEQGVNPEFTVEISDLPAEERIITAASDSSAAKVELVGTEVEGNITKVKLKVIPNADTLGITYIPFKLYSTAKQQEIYVWGQIVPKGHTGCFGR